MENEENVAQEAPEADVQPQETHEAQETPQESDKEINFRKLREAKEQLEKENRELREYYQRQAKPQAESQDEELGLDDDDIVEGKYVKKLDKELRELKKWRQTYEQEKLATIPDRLKTKFNDFDQVVCPENIEKLKIAEPELYSSIMAGGDLYAKGVSAYKTLKAMGIVKEDTYKAQKELAHSNHSKPVSTQAIKGQGALSDANIFANGLTPDLRKQLQKEMQDAAKAH